MKQRKVFNGIANALRNTRDAALEKLADTLDDYDVWTIDELVEIIQIARREKRRKTKE